MKKPITCIMLIDDNPDDNFFHERVIRKFDDRINIVTKESAIEAINYLNQKKGLSPNLIFLDINMPGMNGWDFLDAYGAIEKPSETQIIVVMLSSSDRDIDKRKTSSYPFVSEFKNKPLSQDILVDLQSKYFTF